MEKYSIWNLLKVELIHRGIELDGLLVRKPRSVQQRVLLQGALQKFSLTRPAA